MPFRPFVTCVLTRACSRNAMDNASKNASDMINRLTMQYNRGRQAAITNELVDIITGAFNCPRMAMPLTRYVFQVPVRSKHSDDHTIGRCRVLGCRLVHVVYVLPITIALTFYLMLLAYGTLSYRPCLISAQPRRRSHDEIPNFILSHGPGDVSGNFRSGNCAAPDLASACELILHQYPHIHAHEQL